MESVSNSHSIVKEGKLIRAGEVKTITPFSKDNSESNNNNLAKHEEQNVDSTVVGGNGVQKLNQDELEELKKVNKSINWIDLDV